MTPTAAPAVDPQRVAAFSARLVEAALHTMDIAAVALGDRLGLYAALRDAGPAGLTVGELADVAAVHERYAREWLEQQAVSGVVGVDDVDAAPDARRFALPREHAEVLCDPHSLAYTGPLARALVASVARLDDIEGAFRTGRGVSWEAYGQEAREAQAAFNRPMFEQQLAQQWLPALPDVHERLMAGGARVADVACGGGWSSIAIARAYPGVAVDGYDVDAGSVALAQANAREAGVDDRVRFHVLDVSGPPPASGYDLVTVFEALHDMSRPVEALAGIRAMAQPGGAVLVVDERAAERFTAPGDDLERLLYGFSVLICLPTGMDHDHPVGTGTAMRSDTVRAYAADAGYADVEVLDVEHDLFRLYRLRP